MLQVKIEGKKGFMRVSIVIAIVNGEFADLNKIWKSKTLKRTENAINITA